MDMDALRAEFDDAMMSIYQRALTEVGYKATRFLHMLHEHRGYDTAAILINATNVSEGYTALWERKRLDLTVEAEIHDNKKWQPLFTPEQLRVCEKRLKDYGYI